MSHLTPDELIDAVEGELAPQRQDHLDMCGDCRGQYNALSNVLSDTRDASVPEPSPLFWRQFSAHVRATVDAEQQVWPSWLRWQVLLPLSGVAVVVIALIASLPRRPMPIGHPAAIALDAPLNAGAGDALEFLVGEFDLDAAADAGVLAPGAADEALLQLTADERAELTRLLQAELTRSQS